MGLVSLRSRQSVGTLQQAGSVRSAAFSPDGLELLTSGGEVEWLGREGGGCRRDACPGPG